MRLKTVRDQIRSCIAFIERAELQAEEIRIDLNHEIMFNLRDTYLTVSRQQCSLSLAQLALFLKVPQAQPPLEKMVKWNNQGNSLNLSFAEFSAMLVTKQDRLLAKMVLERQEMGAIPNFLLEKVRAILIKELEIHQYCMECEIDEEELKEWIQTVIDENGDLCPTLLNEFMEVEESSISSNRSILSPLPPFMRFLQTSGNITGERLLFLWKHSPQQTLIQDSSSKMQKMSTYISISPKSLAISHSQHQLIRPQYFDCLNRPLPADATEIRSSKSIEKHICRMSSDKNLRIIAKGERTNARSSKMAVSLLSVLKEIMEVERNTENCRIQLRLCPDFYPILFYESIPKDRTKAITPTNLRDYLESFGFYVEPAQIFLLFRRSGSSKLSFNSFCALFDTVEREFDLLQKNRYVESLQDVHYTTKRHFFTLLIAIINNQLKITQIKSANLKRSKDLLEGINRIFGTFGATEGELTQHELREVFRHYLRINVPITDIRLILRRFGEKGGSEAVRKGALARELLSK